MAIPFIDLKTQYLQLKKSIDGRIQKVLDHGQFVSGPEVAELEKKLVEFTGAKYALACSSGTDALQIPLMALGVKPGDEIITTAFSFIATAEVILLVGAKPVYVDIDPETFNIDPSKIEAVITPKTKGIIPVSLYGQIADMDKINAIAKKHNLFVLEDAAQSFGATQNEKRSCNLTTVGATSFFPAKPLGCYGDGGAIFTNDEKLAKVMDSIRVHGQETRYYHTQIGLNGRLDTLQCAILLAKMERYQWELDQRQKIGDKFNQAFSTVKMDGFTFPKLRPGNASAWAQYTLTVPDRAGFQKRMTELGVPTAVHYPRTMPEQPAYAHTYNPKWDITNSKYAAEHVVSLPMYPDMPENIQNEIIEKTLKALKS